MRAREAWGYLKQQQARLRLQDWDLSMGTSPQASLPGERRHDGAYLVGSMRNADLDVPCADVHVALRRADDAVRETIRHELLHVRLAELQWSFEQALAALPRGEQELLRGHYQSAEERAVNAIARALDD